MSEKKPRKYDKTNLAPNIIKHNEKVQAEQTRIENLGIDATEQIYKKYIELAIAGDKEAMKFIVQRNVPHRWSRMIKVPNCPPIDSVDNIQKASEIVHGMLINGELSVEETEGIMRIYDQVREILAAQQYKVIANEIKYMYENVLKRISIDVMGVEVDERLLLIEQDNQITKFLSIHKGFLNINRAMEVVKGFIKTEEDKIVVLKFLKDACK